MRVGSHGAAGSRPRELARWVSFASLGQPWWSGGGGGGARPERVGEEAMLASCGRPLVRPRWSVFLALVGLLVAATSPLHARPGLGRPRLSLLLFSPQSEFFTAVFGRLPIITPVYVYAAIIAAGGVMMMPPIVAITVRPAPVGRPALVSAVCLVAIAVAIGATVLAPRTPMSDRFGVMCGHCRRRARRFQCGRWPPSNLGVDLAPGAPPGWTLQRDMFQATVPWGRFGHPFVFRTNGPPLGAAPADVAGFLITPGQNGVDVSVSLVPRRVALAVSFVPPAGLAPSRSNLPACRGLVNGRPRSSRRRWTVSRGARRSIQVMPPGYATSGLSSPIQASRTAPGGSACPAGCRRIERCGTPRPPGSSGAAEVGPLEPVSPLR